MAVRQNWFDGVGDGTFGRIRATLARSPLTVGFLAVIGVVALAVHEPGARLHEHHHQFAVGVPALADGRWWTPLTAGLVGHGPAAYLLTIVLAVLLLPTAERRLGSMRALAVLLAAQVLGSLAGIGLVQFWAALGGQWAGQLARATELGPDAAVLATALAASASMGALWRRRLRLVLVSLLLVMALYSGLLVDVTRLAVGLTGLGLGVLVRRGPRPASRAPSVSETRALVALLLVLTALGPVAAALAGTPIGPLSVLRHVVVPELPDAGVVRAMCAAPGHAQECRELHTALRLSGWGPAALAIVPVLLLLVIAEGLRRGRRAAWWAGIAVNTVLLGLGAVQAATVVATPAEKIVYTAGLPAGQSILSVLLPLAVPVVVLAVLLAARGRFGVRRPGGGRALLGIGVALAATAAGWLLGGWATGAGFDHPPSWHDLLAELPQRYVPPAYLVEAAPRILPVHPLSTIVFEWTGVLFWFAATLLLVRLFTTHRGNPHAPDRDIARALLTEDPRSDLGQLAVWPGHHYWFTPDGRTAIAYRVIGSVALSTGGPFGATATDDAAIAGFTRYCKDLGLLPCFYTITESTNRHCAANGFASLQVAEETVLALPGLSFSGKRWQDVRTARNRAGKLGIVAEWFDYADTPLEIREEIRAISEEWVANKGLPEMGFTLGGLAELAEPGTRLLLAVDAERNVHGVTSWLPVYRHGVVVGWTLDFMRRRTSQSGGPEFNGVMEFLIAEAAVHCRDEGAEFLSLSGAPLARLDRGERPTWLQRLLDWLSTAMEPVYGFRSLLAFKAKFQPEYRPLYMAYPETAALPMIGRAIMHAYLPTMSPRQLARLTRKLFH